MTRRRMASGTSLERKLDFYSREDPLSGCLEWTAYRDSWGYGVVCVGRKQVKAHRASYEVHVAPIPAGSVIDHRCHNTSCINPEHLRMVTPNENAQNRKGARRDSSSGIRGVTWHSRFNKWQVSVTANSKRIHVGYFMDLKSAEAAAVSARLRLHTNPSNADLNWSLLPEDKQ